MAVERASHDANGSTSVDLLIAHTSDGSTVAVVPVGPALEAESRPDPEALEATLGLRSSSASELGSARTTRASCSARMAPTH